VNHWQVEFDRCSNLIFREGPRTATKRVGYRVGSEDNENVILFRERACLDVVTTDDPCWASGSCGNAYDCWEHSGGTIALTTTSYDPGNGRLFDADVEANAAYFLFTTVDSPECPPGDLTATCVAFDVENTFTHELGHVVGLAHTANPGSTMNPSAPLGETSKRTIDPGSLGFVCQAYPRGLPSTTCLPPPEAIEGSSLSCSVSPGQAGWLSTMLGLAFLRARKRRESVS
jgi:hypothetical protein